MRRERLEQGIWHRWKVLLVTLVLVLLVWLLPAAAFAEPITEPSIPTVPIEWEGHYARTPDWSRITFRTLPPILSDGSFESPPDVNGMLGYDLSRIWKAGQTADTYLKLGDFQSSLYLQIFNLYTIAQSTHLDLKQIALSALEMAAWQSLDDLVTAIPGLGNFRVSEVPAIAALLRKSNGFPGTPGFNPNATIPGGDTIADVLNANPDLGQLKLGDLGEQLNSFAIADIPGLQNVPLQNLKDWGDSTIGGVPGLADVPFDQMPNPVGAAGILGMVDVVYGAAESDRQNTISGSKQEGFAVPCQTECGYVEMAGSPALYGKQWISGKYQKVRGGEGALAAVNGGKEPTGRHPFGDAFKVVLWDVDEFSGTASTALFFRICHHFLGCTPYFLGPVPFLSYGEKEFMLVGLLDSLGGSSAAASIPTEVWERARAFGVPSEALAGLGGFTGWGGFSLCGEGLGGVDFAALAAAFSSIEGNYSSVGTYVCDGDGNCGRGLGRYQYMSYRADVRSAIRQQPGGAAFLAKLDSGAGVTSAELDRFFPSTVQDSIFKGDQTRNLQQAMQEGFSGSRLIERVGQIHFGGSGAPIDGGASDIHGRLTLKTYGQKLGQQYESALAAGVGRKCTTADNGLDKGLPAGSANQRISQSLEQMGNFATSSGPSSGRLACAWAVNRVLSNAGIQPLGSNPNYVPSVEAALRGGRGTPVSQSQAQAGDIVIASNAGHIGICLNQGCTRVRSNSSSRARFTWDSNFNFDGEYGGGQSRVYRVKS